MATSSEITRSASATSAALTREGDGIATHMQIGAQCAFEGAQVLICRTQQAHDEIGRNIDAAADLSVGVPGSSCVSSAGLAGRHVVSDACFLFLTRDS